MRVDQLILGLLVTSALGGCGDDGASGSGTTTTTSDASTSGPGSSSTFEGSTASSTGAGTSSGSDEGSSSSTGTGEGSSSSVGSSSSGGADESSGSSSSGSTGASGVCGDGIVNADDELCDGDDLDGQTCASVGLEEGELGCSGQCGWDLTACVGCGNGLLEGDEVCDNFAFGGVSCASLGYASGNPSCSLDCTLIDTSDCVPYAGNCCGANGSLGCSVPECVLAVCELDAYCCNVEWDDTCAGTAYNHCDACM